jgi:hypothetical protein
MTDLDSASGLMPKPGDWVEVLSRVKVVPRKGKVPRSVVLEPKTTLFVISVEIVGDRVHLTCLSSEHHVVVRNHLITHFYENFRHVITEQA